jgi:HSP20 family protein
MTFLTTLLPALNRSEASRPQPAGDDLGAILRPVHDITETPEAYGLTVELPGVAKAGLELTADDTQVRIVGRRTWTPPAGWSALHRETADASFELVLAHDHAIEVDRIAAELRDGILRVSLPKTEALKPRRITVA